MKPVFIDDPADLRLDPYVSIRERDLVGRHGRFVAEGKIVVNTLLASPFQPESVLILESRLPGMEKVLQKAPDEMPVYVASQKVMDAVVGFHIHRGVLAVGMRGPALAAGALADALPDRSLAIVLVGLANHDNVGSIFRNAAAFGADAVFLDEACCDPLYRKAIRVSAGAALKVPFATVPNADVLVDILAARGFDQLALSPEGATNLRHMTTSQRLALFLGTEGDGLPADLLARLETVRISMSPGFDSLNVAAASAVALHHFSRN